MLIDLNGKLLKYVNRVNSKQKVTKNKPVLLKGEDEDKIKHMKIQIDFRNVQNNTDILQKTRQDEESDEEYNDRRTKKKTTRKDTDFVNSLYSKLKYGC